MNDRDSRGRQARTSLPRAALLAAGIIGLPFLVVIVTVSAGTPGFPQRFVELVGAIGLFGLVAVEFVALVSLFRPAWRDAASLSIAGFAGLLLLLLLMIAVRQGSPGHG